MGTPLAAPARMVRKPVMMPQALAARVEALAEEAGVSFAEIVRRAVAQYDPALEAHLGGELETLAEAVIRSTEETVAHVDEVMRRLDETHATLREGRRHGAR